MVVDSCVSMQASTSEELIDLEYRSIDSRSPVKVAVPRRSSISGALPSL